MCIEPMGVHVLLGGLMLPPPTPPPTPPPLSAEAGEALPAPPPSPLEPAMCAHAPLGFGGGDDALAGSDGHEAFWKPGNDGAGEDVVDHA